MSEIKEKQTILCVDDDSDLLSQLELRLTGAGYRVLTAGGEVAAERAIESQNFDLAILDLMMEHQDSGFTVAYHLKKKRPAVPVILLSNVMSETGNQFDASTREERRWLKADLVLKKGIRFEQLHSEIKKLFRE